MTGFTPKEWRTAARVARRSIFTEGRPDLADAWDKAADQAEARLIPAGGMALTAEQVEDVRLLLGLNGSQSIEVVLDASVRLRALFPATEPAEEAKPCGSNSVTLGWCKLTARHEGLHTNGTYLWGTPSEPDPPAPAEPAEEETKAEVHDPDALAKRLAWIWHDGWDACGERERGCLRRAAEMAHSHYASSPVVPAPTETEVEPETWTCLNAVPVNVPKVVDSYGFTWRRSNDGWEYKTPNGWVPAIESVFHGSYVAAPTETGPWKHRDGRLCVATPDRIRAYVIGDFNGNGAFIEHGAVREVPEGFAPFVAVEEG